MQTIKEVRISKGLRQIDVVLGTGLSLPAVSRAENGKQVSRSTFQAICKFLEVDPSEVVAVPHAGPRKIA